MHSKHKCCENPFNRDGYYKGQNHRSYCCRPSSQLHTFLGGWALGNLQDVAKRGARTDQEHGETMRVQQRSLQQSALMLEVPHRPEMR